MKRFTCATTLPVATAELWYHAFGCRSWLRVTRDTRTHEIFAVELCIQGSERMSARLSPASRIDSLTAA